MNSRLPLQSPPWWHPHSHCLICFEPFELPNQGVKWIARDGTELGPKEDGDYVAQRRWDQAQPRAHCASGDHLLPRADSILMGVFGQTLTGKDSLIQIMRSEAAGRLRPHSLSILPHDEDLAVWREQAQEWKATAPASSLEPYVPREFRVTDSSSRVPTQRSLMVFNTSGEDFVEADPGYSFRHACPFTPELDVIVLTVAPPCLSDRDFPPVGDREAQQSLEETIAGIGRIESYLVDEKESADRRRTVIVVLTKCDRYRGHPDFPQSVLSPRAGSSLWTTVIEEQALLAAFLLKHNGGAVLDAARRIGEPPFIVALSGTGTDEGPLGHGYGQAAPPGTDPARSLDPLLITCARHGLGQYV